MTYTPFPVWPAPEGSSGGSGGGANEVFFAYYLFPESLVGEFGTYTAGVSIVSGEGDVPVGLRSVVILDGGGYASFVGDGTTTMLYEDPQLSTFARLNRSELFGGIGGQAALLNVYVDFSLSGQAVNTTYQMLGQILVPQGPPVIQLAGLVAAAAGSTLVQGLTYFVSDVGSGMLALASTDATYAFLGTLALDHDDPVPTGYIGHFTRTPAP